MQTELSIIQAQSETLGARQWAQLIGITKQAFLQADVAVAAVVDRRNLYEFDRLPIRWQNELEAKRKEQCARTYAELLQILHTQKRRRHVDLRAISAGRFTHFAEFPPAMQQAARSRRAAILYYYKALDDGRTKEVAKKLAAAEWEKFFGGTCAERTIRNWVAKAEKHGGPEAPEEAFLDGKACAHPNARKELPAALIADFRSRMTDPRYGVPSAASIHRDYSYLWEMGAELPGLGARTHEAEPFPITLAQLQKISPARAVRVIAGKGKLAAKTKKLLAAPPLDWSNVEPMKVVMFDDKVLDCMVLTDDGLRAFRPVIYLAYCAGTGRVLSFITREEGRMTQLDVEGLEAAVLRDHGFHEPSIWVRERGTVSMSRGRKEFLESRFNGRLLIHETMMIGGKNLKGDWAQASKGNFFGKGRMEAFMWTLDNLARPIPGQTGNRYAEQPAMLGDTTLTLQTIINSAAQNRRVVVGGQLSVIPRNRASGSLLEESILTAAMSRVIAWMENGENVKAIEAAMQTGIRPPMMYYSDFVAVLGELFRRHNNRRGHAMQGFERIRVANPKLAPIQIAQLGGSPCPQSDDSGPKPTDWGQSVPPYIFVSESPNDKAARMFAKMQLEGRNITRPSDKDIFLLLHKVTRVVVSANGAVVNGVRYSHKQSRAQQAAASIAGGKKVFLAIYNPIAPDALYLLVNPPSHLNASATELPHGFGPQLYEVLPRYEAPDPTNADAMRERSRDVAEFNGQFARAVAVYAAPRLLEQSAPRKELNDRLEPLRATVMSSRPPVEPLVATDGAHLADHIAAAERVVTRAEELQSTERDFANYLAKEEE